ncbi:MAG: hypothetical protein EOP45_02310 [Sphingobacteriaceae bacterium]|nr:MAG: hypothetical protein EOP45_02310 [Sphingobacteriaceae bacterium]
MVPDHKSISPGCDPFNIKILVDTNIVNTYIADYIFIYNTFKGCKEFQKHKTTENHWRGFHVTSIELKRMLQIGNKRTTKSSSKHTQTEPPPPRLNIKLNPPKTNNKNTPESDQNTPSTISDLEFDDYITTLTKPIT